MKVKGLEASVRELRATDCEIPSSPGELPIKCRDPNGVVAELVPVGRYKTP
jgi:hypothetical protein